jgi:hypothetical protein
VIVHQADLGSMMNSCSLPQDQKLLMRIPGVSGKTVAKGLFILNISSNHFYFFEQNYLAMVG